MSDTKTAVFDARSSGDVLGYATPPVRDPSKISKDYALTSKKVIALVAFVVFAALAGVAFGLKADLPYKIVPLALAGLALIYLAYRVYKDRGNRLLTLHIKDYRLVADDHPSYKVLSSMAPTEFYFNGDKVQVPPVTIPQTLLNYGVRPEALPYCSLRLFGWQICDELGEFGGYTFSEFAIRVTLSKSGALSVEAEALYRSLSTREAVKIHVKLGFDQARVPQELTADFHLVETREEESSAQATTGSLASLVQPARLEDRAAVAGIRRALRHQPPPLAH